MVAFPYRAQADWGTELTINAATFTGAAQLLGSFLSAPSMIIIQNDTNQTVTVRRFADNTLGGISFVTGTKLVLDMITNKANAEFFSFPAHTPIYVSGAAGAGLFKIAYIFGVA